RRFFWALALMYLSELRKNKDNFDHCSSQHFYKLKLGSLGNTSEGGQKILDVLDKKAEVSVKCGKHRNYLFLMLCLFNIIDLFIFTKQVRNIMEGVVVLHETIHEPLTTGGHVGIKTYKALREGDPLSPILFNIGQFEGLILHLLSNSDWKTIEINYVYVTTIALGSSVKENIIKKQILGGHMDDDTVANIGLELFWRLLYCCFGLRLRFDVIFVCKVIELWEKDKIFFHQGESLLSLSTDSFIEIYQFLDGAHISCDTRNKDPDSCFININRDDTRLRIIHSMLGNWLVTDRIHKHVTKYWRTIIFSVHVFCQIIFNSLLFIKYFVCIYRMPDMPKRSDMI
ncbi:hypothetical protein ACJX0J_011809, partial [Zea mays]